MKQLILLITLFSLLSCNSHKSIKEKTLCKLDTEMAVNYSYSNLIIQGSGKSVDDTTFINVSTTASFIKLSDDSTFNYVVEDSLVHPLLRVPFKNIYHYDGQIYTYALISSLKKDLQKKEELKPTVVNNLMRKHLPTILQILQDENTLTLNDSIIDGDVCSQYELTIDGVPYSLYVSKKHCIPVFLRVVKSISQPLIEEYSYHDFTFSDELVIPNYEEQVKRKNTQPVLPIAKGDTFPDWEFGIMDGGKVLITSTNNIKVVYLSMINCGACRKALPYIEKIHNKYMKDNTVNFFVLYPVDKKEKLSKYIENKLIKTPILYNKETDEKDFRNIVHKLRMGYPSTIILNKENEVIHIINGFNASLEKYIEKEIIKENDKSSP